MMCSYLMSKRKILMVCLLLLFTTLLSLPIKGSNGNIDQYSISLGNGFKENFNDELLYKSNRPIESDHFINDSIYLSHEISKLNSLNHVSASLINGFQKQSKIDLSAIDPSSFVSLWNTSLTSDGSTSKAQLKLPLEEIGTYNFNVDWGDGGINNTITSWNQAEGTHTYSSEGVYTIIIEGTLVGWRFNNTGDRLKIIEISQWGDIRLGNSASYFYGSSNLVLTATDTLDLAGTTTLRNTFRDNVNLGNNGNMNSWDVSSVTDMSGMFYEGGLQIYNFNQPLDNWNVSSVKNMSGMFLGGDTFNQSLNNWDVSSVTDMSNMFHAANSFNQSLNK